MFELSSPLLSAQGAEESRGVLGWESGSGVSGASGKAGKSAELAGRAQDKAVRLCHALCVRVPPSESFLKVL